MNQAQDVELVARWTLGLLFGRSMTWELRARVVMEEETPHIPLPSPHPALRCKEETTACHAEEPEAAPAQRNAGMEEVVILSAGVHPSALERMNAGVAELFAQGKTTVSKHDLAAHTGVSLSAVRKNWKALLAAMPDVEEITEKMPNPGISHMSYKRKLLRRKVAQAEA
ncbi:MAG: hypothetical protein EI684_10450 [Candidatus Viridilinea halotolerans]|uniref:Uncharacterized protein n=1 Tax=Candidatus Viridilinea halotolerans TaxID=2491704 RepID=A0A426U096_9CHLR|nr:MAG: hypothetical protein EI684_10450 [Candidatus Viridilinea halotolerans]